MNKKQFDNKYKGIKMNKFVPLLEKQIKIEITRRKDWMATCFDWKDKFFSLASERRYYLFLIGLLVVWGGINFMLLMLKMLK